MESKTKALIESVIVQWWLYELAKHSPLSTMARNSNYWLTTFLRWSIRLVVNALTDVCTEWIIAESRNIGLLRSPGIEDSLTFCQFVLHPYKCCISRSTSRWNWFEVQDWKKLIFMKSKNLSRTFHEQYKWYFKLCMQYGFVNTAHN